MAAISIYALETQPIVVEGLRHVFAETEDIELIGAGQELVPELFRQNGPGHLILMGQPPGSRSILPLLISAKEIGASSPIIAWVSGVSEVEAFRAIQLGARGVVLREQNVPVLLDCIRTVARGAVWMDPSIRGAVREPSGNRVRLTPREREIVELVALGRKNKEIGTVLGISAGTVKVHLMHIFEKTGAGDRYQLALEAKRLLSDSNQPSPELQP